MAKFDSHQTPELLSWLLVVYDAAWHLMDNAEFSSFTDNITPENDDLQSLNEVLNAFEERFPEFVHGEERFGELIKYAREEFASITGGEK